MNTRGEEGRKGGGERQKTLMISETIAVVLRNQHVCMSEEPEITGWLVGWVVEWQEAEQIGKGFEGWIRETGSPYYTISEFFVDVPSGTAGEFGSEPEGYGELYRASS